MDDTMTGDQGGALPRDERNKCWCHERRRRRLWAIDQWAGRREREASRVLAAHFECRIPSARFCGRHGRTVAGPTWTFDILPLSGHAARFLALSNQSIQPQSAEERP